MVARAAHCVLMTYQPLIDISPPALTCCAASALKRGNRPDDDVGRLHYSLSITLSAQFR